MPSHVRPSRPPPAATPPSRREPSRVRENPPNPAEWPRAPGLFETLRREMLLRNYSQKTIKAYTSCIRLLARHFYPRHPRLLNAQEIRDYLLCLMETKQYSAATINQVLNALRFLYVELYKQPFILGDIRRPKKEQKLPVVLSFEEVKQILDSLESLKHKTVLMMIYSGGLRLGEVVRLRPEDYRQ